MSNSHKIHAISSIKSSVVAVGLSTTNTLDSVLVKVVPNPTGTTLVEEQQTRTQPVWMVPLHKIKCRLAQQIYNSLVVKGVPSSTGINNYIKVLFAKSLSWRAANKTQPASFFFYLVLYPESSAQQLHLILLWKLCRALRVRHRLRNNNRKFS